MTRALLIMVKAPVPGGVKTRLTPPLSPEQAAELYGCFLRDGVEQYSSLGPSISPLAFYAPPEPASLDRLSALYPPSWPLLPQYGANFGIRMHEAFRTAFQNGAQTAVIIGTDHPTVPTEHISRAFQLLECGPFDMVIGPSEDGGFYLMGLKRPVEALFTEIVFSTETVFQEIMAIAERDKLATEVIPTWYDIDHYEDLHRILKESEAPDSPAYHPRHTVNYLQKLEIQS